MHAHAHTHTHTHTHMHTHTHTNTQTRACTRTHTHTDRHTQIHKYSITTHLHCNPPTQTFINQYGLFSHMDSAYVLTARIGGSQAVEAQPAVLRKLLSVCHSAPCWTASRSQGIVN